MKKRILSADANQSGQYSISYLTLFFSTVMIAFVLYVATAIPVGWMMENPPFSVVPQFQTAGNSIGFVPLSEPTIWYFIGYGAYVVFLILSGFFLTRFLAGRRLYLRKQERT